MLRARDLLGRFDRVSNREARTFVARAIQLSPGYAEAYVVLAEAEYDRATMGWVEDPAEAVRRAEECGAARDRNRRSGCQLACPWHPRKPLL